MERVQSGIFVFDLRPSYFLESISTSSASGHALRVKSPRPFGLGDECRPRLEDLAPFRGSWWARRRRHHGWLNQPAVWVFCAAACVSTMTLKTEVWSRQDLVTWSLSRRIRASSMQGFAVFPPKIVSGIGAAGPLAMCHLLGIGQYGLHVAALARCSRMLESPLHEDLKVLGGNLHEDIGSFLCVACVGS
jgi:hypothetical protein